MGKLAELAQTSKLKGPVAVTTLRGGTITYEDEAAAEAACSGMSLEHRRGAFFEVERARVAAPPPPPPAKKKVKRDEED